jgi:hypothetical protein
LKTGWWQAWINSTIRAETSASNISLEDLVNGKSDAFVALHTAGILSLVTNDAPMSIKNVPETLLFDVGHLRSIQMQFDRIVSGATFLTMAEHEMMRSEKKASPEKHALIKQLLSQVADLIINNEEFDTISEKFAQKLDMIEVLTDEVKRANVIETIKKSINHKEDHVRGLL